MSHRNLYYTDTQNTSVPANQLRNLFIPGDPQEEIQAAINRDGYAYLLPGEYTFTETLVLPKQYRCALIGLGAGTGYVKSSPISPGLLADGAVIINWDGNETDPMIRVRGAEWKLDGLSLLGPAATGLLIENNNTGLGTGKGYVPNLTVADCTVAVQFGSEATGDNGDVTSFGRLSAYDCGTIVKVIAPLGFELHFGYIRNARCDVVFDCQDGGGLHSYGGQILGGVDDGVLLKLGVVDPNSSSYVIQGWHIDSGATSAGFKLLECTDRSWADVSIQAHLPQGDYPVPIAELVGPVRLVLDGCANLRPGAVDGTTHAAGDPVVIARDCRLRGTWAAASDLLTGDGTAIMNDCYDNTGAIFAPA